MWVLKKRCVFLFTCPKEGRFIIMIILIGFLVPASVHDTLVEMRTANVPTCQRITTIALRVHTHDAHGLCAVLLLIFGCLAAVSNRITSFPS